MDQYLILEFETQIQADTALTAINAIAAQWWTGQGFTVDNDGLIGRNASSGQDNPKACRTVTWAQTYKSPDSTFYFSSLSNDTRFVNWRDYLPEGINIGTEKSLPTIWLSSEEI